MRIKDLAKRLSVSISTVYRALHDAPDVNKKTKEAVVKLASELKYEPDAIAQGLVTRQSKLIGVLVPTIQSDYFSDALSGMTDAANESDYHIIFYQSNENEKQEIAGIRSLISCNVDGLLISVSKETKSNTHLESVKVPVVMYDRVLKDFECTKVIVDEYEGAFNAVSYLIKKGCRRIAHVAGPQNLSICVNRLNGYKDALIAHNIPVDKKMISQTKSFEENALNAIKKILEQENPPDGIFLVNDLSAVLAIKYLNRKGIMVPENVQIIGFNDDKVCEIVEPTLTSVMQPGYEVGKLAMGLLIDEIKTKKVKNKTYKLKTNLVIRGSTK